MTTNRKAASPVLADHLGETAYKHQSCFNFFSPKPPLLILNQWLPALSHLTSIIWLVIIVFKLWGKGS